MCLEMEKCEFKFKKKYWNDKEAKIMLKKIIRERLALSKEDTLARRL